MPDDRDLKITATETCPKCKGTGWEAPGVGLLCLTCSGKKRFARELTLDELRELLKPAP